MQSGFTQSISAELEIRFVQRDALRQIDVYAGDQFFTSYIYRGGSVKKPVLYPIYTTAGHACTRGFPFGSKIYSEGAEELNFELLPGASVEFHHRVLIFSRDPGAEEIEAAFQAFGGE